MIKKLIEDIANESISVEQALTRSKIIAHRLGDKTFLDWITCELKGYDAQSPIDLPDYREFPCQVEGTAIGRYRQSQTVPIYAPEVDKMLEGMLYKIIVNNGIPNLERTLRTHKSDMVHSPLPTGMALMFTQELGLEAHEYSFLEVYKKYGKSQIEDVILQTKQILLDALLKLNDQFPDLDDEYKFSTEEKEIINQTINTTIYGSHNVSTVGLGHNIEQNVSLQLFHQQLNAVKDKLKSFGVQDEDISELESQIDDKDDEPTIRKKVMKWIGNLCQKAIEKGIDYKLPEIIDTVSGML